MNYGPLLRKLGLSLILITFPAAGQAQDNYTPPPMFGAPDPLPPVTPETLPQPQKAKPAARNTNAELPPTPKKKPSFKTDTQKVETKKTKGIVKGPKTMPAVPAKGYASETLFENEDGEIEGAILKRHAKTEENSEAKAAQPIKEAPKSKLDVFALQDGKAQKITITYPAGQEETSKGLISEAIAIQSQKLLKDNQGWRVQIRSYASAYDEGQSSDRRMALNRALSLREALIKNGVEPRLVDVRALGDKAQDGEKDRIDMIFYAQDATL